MDPPEPPQAMRATNEWLTMTYRRSKWSRAAMVCSATVLAATLVPLGIAHAGGLKAKAWKKATDGATITTTQQLGPLEYDITISSPALGRSVRTRILVPKGWTAGTTRTWPVLYAYHGGNDDYTSWTANSPIASLAAAYNVIVVMPEGADGSYTNWYNYGKGGTPAWETFHTQEVMQLIQANWHGSTARAALGNSSGGEGAFSYAARHPGMFRYAASLSGVLWTEEAGVPALLMAINTHDFSDPFKIWGIPYLDQANWAAHDPYVLAPALKGTKLFFSSGTTGRPGPGDPSVAPWDIGLLSEVVVGSTNVNFRQRLDQLGIPYTADIYGDGRHNWPAWTRETNKIWPNIMQAIGATPVS